MAGTPEGRDGVYARVYSPTFLSMIYDYLVLKFNLRYMWGCAADTILLPFFSENFSRRHLDIGVATGWFPAVALARPFRATSRQHITLLDISGNSLRAAQARVQASNPVADVQCVEADVTAPLPKALLAPRASEDQPATPLQFDSISMFNLFHCVPGPDKLKALTTYKELLSDHGVLSGCTVLGEKHATGWLTRWYVRYYNKVGLFNNLHDTREMFEKALHQEFEDVDTWVIGMTLLFRATKPRKMTADLLV